MLFFFSQKDTVFSISGCWISGGNVCSGDTGCVLFFWIDIPFQTVDRVYIMILLILYLAELAAGDLVCRFPKSVPQITLLIFFMEEMLEILLSSHNILGPTMIGFTAFFCFLPLPIGWWHCVRAINPILRTCYKCTAAEARHSLQDILSAIFFFRK